MCLIFISYSHSQLAPFLFKTSKWPSALTISAFFITPVQLIVVSLHKSLHTQSPSAVSRSSSCPAPEVTYSHAVSQQPILSNTREPILSNRYQTKLPAVSHPEWDTERWVNFEAALMIKIVQEAFLHGMTIVKVVSCALRRGNFLVV